MYCQTATHITFIKTRVKWDQVLSSLQLFTINSVGKISLARWETESQLTSVTSRLFWKREKKSDEKSTMFQSSPYKSTGLLIPLKTPGVYVGRYPTLNFLGVDALVLTIQPITKTPQKLTYLHLNDFVPCFSTPAIFYPPNLGLCSTRMDSSPPVLRFC